MLANNNNAFIAFIDFNKNHLFDESIQPAYFQLGFICSVQAVPELIDLENWLAYLWCDGDINFESESQATEYAQAVLSMVETINDLYEQALPLVQLNSMQWINEENRLNEDAKAFATGFLAAIEVFNDEWVLVEDNETLKNMLQTTILLLTKLTKDENTGPELLTLFTQLPDTSEILTILPSLISNLAYSAAQASLNDNE